MKKAAFWGMIILNAALAIACVTNAIVNINGIVAGSLCMSVMLVVFLMGERQGSIAQKCIWGATFILAGWAFLKGFSAEQETFKTSAIGWLVLASSCLMFGYDSDARAKKNVA